MYVTLVGALTYDFAERKFIKGEEVKVDKKTADQLKDNPQFKVSDKPASKEDEAPVQGNE